GGRAGGPSVSPRARFSPAARETSGAPPRAPRAAPPRAPRDCEARSFRWQRRSRTQGLEAAGEPVVDLRGVPRREATVRRSAGETGVGGGLGEVGDDAIRGREARDPSTRAIDLALVDGGAVPAEHDRAAVET